MVPSVKLVHMLGYFTSQKKMFMNSYSSYSFLLFFVRESLYVAQAGLEFLILLPLPPE
jgi:hypothetical protein